MKNSLCILLIFFLFFKNYVVGQNYKVYAERADSFLQAGNFLKAAEQYNKAFYSIGGKGSASHRYKAAIAYSQLNQKDSAFKQLICISEKTHNLECEKLKAQTEFNVLRADNRWDTLITNTCGTNESLTRLLFTILVKDQALRKDIHGIGTEFGYGSVEMEGNWTKIKQIDSLNLKQSDSIYSIYGWPGPSLVGKKATHAFFLIVQHAPLKGQQRYLPVLKKAVIDKKATPAELAYLEDRIAMRTDQPQKYGTQYIIRNDEGKQRLYKLQDAEHLNKTREEVGLPALSEDEIKSVE